MVLYIFIPLKADTQTSACGVLRLHISIESFHRVLCGFTADESTESLIDSRSQSSTVASRVFLAHSVWHTRNQGGGRRYALPRKLFTPFKIET